MATGWNFESYLDHSRKLDVTDIPWHEVPQHPLGADEIRVVRYFMDIESQILIFLRELLSSSSVHEPDVAAFFACWGYEEYFHGRALKRFLRAYGVPVDDTREAHVEANKSPLYYLRLAAQTAISKLAGPRFVATHMAWGALDEMTTLQGYRQLARKTRHPILREIFARIMKDERRHFAFYFNQARHRLQDPAARKLAHYLVTRFWKPVGDGIEPPAEVDLVATYLFDDEEGLRAAAHVDATIATLPGFAGFSGLQQVIATAATRRAKQPALAAAAAVG